jgi:apolipoprotein N-acyltransferase
MYHSVDLTEPARTNQEKLGVGASPGEDSSSADLVSDRTHFHKFLNNYSVKELGYFLLALSAIAAGFGNSLEPVSILTLVHIFLLLTGFELALRDDNMLSREFGILCFFLLVTQALGFCLGFCGILGFPSTTVGTVFLAIALGILVWIIYLLLALIPTFLFYRKYPKSYYIIFVFPILHTFAFCTVLGNFFSTFASLGNGFLDYAPLRQFATLFGIYGINFIVVLLATLPTLYYSRYNQLKKISFHSFKEYYFLSLIILFLVTGFLIQSNYLYQKHVPPLLVTKIPVSCILSQTVEYNSYEYGQLWNSTANRIKAGDAIVLMSEEAMMIRSRTEEDEIIKKAISLAATTTNADGVLLGITYELKLEGDDLATNQFALLSSEQTTPLWQYTKAYPVPFVETDVRPGTGGLPTASSNYGELSGAICFDLDFPQYIAEAGRKEIDLFLQPSWTWNAINYRHFDGDSLRAIENGFTLFRCSSDGESGIVDPYGKFLARQYTGHDPNDVSTFQLPLNKRVVTFYPFLGFIIEYVFIAISIITYFLIILPSDFSIFRRN